MSIAVQGAVGDIGRKATTELLGFDFQSMAVINGLPFGANASGLFKLNSGDTDNGKIFTRTFTLATSDFGIQNFKRLRFIYIGIDTADQFTLSVKVDRQSWQNYTVVPKKTGLQEIRVPIGNNIQGRYWTIKISSTANFRVANIQALPIVRAAGITGY